MSPAWENIWKDVKSPYHHALPKKSSVSSYPMRGSYLYDVSSTSKLGGSWGEGMNSLYLV